MMILKPKLEIACFNLESALIASAGGADRVELCIDRAAGGLTPDPKTVEAAAAMLDIPVMAMIRPRGGNFVYSDAEFGQMKKDISLMIDNGADGFVFGILTEDGHVDKTRNEMLVRHAAPLPCTFHRAFDQTPDALAALEAVIECGFQTILTSGHQREATSAVAELTTLAGHARGRIMIMPGGGLRSANISGLSAALAFARPGQREMFFHSAAIVDSGETADPEEVKELKRNLR